jgi:hypothetical protein
MNIYRLPDIYSMLLLFEKCNFFRNSFHTCSLYLPQAIDLSPHIYFLAMLVWALHSPRCETIAFSSRRIPQNYILKGWIYKEGLRDGGINAI